MIRLATLADIPRIVELGSQSLLEGPYKKAADRPDLTGQFARRVIEHLGRVLLWEENGEITGLLGFIVSNHPYTGERTAQEVMWFVLKERRAGGAGIKLLWEAEEQARTMGAKTMQVTSPLETVASIYRRFGYSFMETAFQKELTPCRS